MIKNLLILLGVCLPIFSCSENSHSNSLDDVNTKLEVEGLLYQDGGCVNGGLYKSNFIDSCFSYSFTDTLKVDFCFTSNCCPDSARAQLNYKVSNDTIFIFLDDIAPELCNCICKYIVRSEFTNLQLDKYYIKVDFCLRAYYGDTVYVPFYFEEVSN